MPNDSSLERAIAFATKYLVAERFERNDPTLPGTPDLAFKKSKVAVFIHGCFWHQHACRPLQVAIGRDPVSWAFGFERVVKNDKRNATRLRQAGWTVVVLWECKIKEDILRELDRVRQVLHANTWNERTIAAEPKVGRFIKR